MSLRLYFPGTPGFLATPALPGPGAPALNDDCDAGAAVFTGAAPVGLADDGGADAAPVPLFGGAAALDFPAA